MRLAATLSLLALITSCSNSRDHAVDFALPPANGMLDYQLGGAYLPTADTEIVARDRAEVPAEGRYNICYVNGFQTQPDEAAMWLTEHPDLLLRDADGNPLFDPAWPEELILDVSTSEQRTQLLAIVGEWIDACAQDGFQAVEIDNLDTYTRFPAELNEDDAIAFARALADRAHAAGLGIAQKNSPDLVPRRNETTFDFVVVEQCNQYEECELFTAGYGGQVYIIEYDREAFARGCTTYPQLSIVLRDLEVSPPGSATYVRDAC